MMVTITILILTDLRKSFDTLIKFPWLLLPLILLSTFLNYIIRFFKWHYYLHLLDINISAKDSLIIFLSGLMMAISPGKFGEVLKSLLVKQLNGTEISRTAPIIMAERLTDVIGLIFLASLGISTLRFGLGVLIFTSILVIVFIVFVQSRSLSLSIISASSRFPIISRFTPNLKIFYESSYSLLRIDALLIAVLLSIVSWFFECLSLFIIFKGYGIHLSLLAATFIYSFASLAGAISMIPGGLAVAEGSITGLLIMLGVAKEYAAATTIIIRFSTLWFAVIIGAIVLSLYSHKFHLSNDINP